MSSTSAAVPAGAPPGAPLRRLVAAFERAVCEPTDTPDQRVPKLLFTAALAAITPIGFIWGAIYAALGEPVAGVFPAAYAVLTIVNLAVLLVARDFRAFRLIQLTLILVLPLCVQLALGGFVGGSVVVVWGLVAPLMAMLFSHERAGLRWFVAYLATVVIAAVAQPQLTVDNALPDAAIRVFFVLNLVAMTSVVALTLYSFTRSRRRLRELEVAFLDQEVMLREAEKLATLGTLAAGVAHELNNPASAVARGADHLDELFDQLRDQCLDQLERTTPGARQLTEALVSETPRVRSPLERADATDAMTRWLTAHGIDVAWDLAPALVDRGLDADRLTSFDAGSGELGTVLRFASRTAEATTVLGEVAEGARRISAIVGAMRSYSYLDQAPVNDVDVIEGLESTLVLLNDRLRGGIEVRRAYAEDVPRISAYGSELNQVWTNLIVNALDALDGSGVLTLRVSATDDHVTVEVEDDGPGMSEEVAARVFEPFFTTKPPGQGTGLGLNVSHNIVVQKHRGRIAVTSRPGRTTFTVTLPVDGGDTAQPV